VLSATSAWRKISTDCKEYCELATPRRAQLGGLKKKKKEEELIRLPWRGQCGRAAAGSAALSLRCAASTSANVYTGYA
jgi:hypothetical protein